jgi:hypothetical protein
MSGGMKLSQSDMVRKGFQELGYPSNTIVPIGIVEIACAVIYLFPRTAMLGAILDAISPDELTP